MPQQVEEAPAGAQEGGAQGLVEALGAQMQSFQAMGEALSQVGAPPKAMEIVQIILSSIQDLGDVLGGGGAPQGPVPANGADANVSGNPNARPVM